MLKLHLEYLNFKLFYQKFTTNPYNYVFKNQTH